MRPRLIALAATAGLAVAVVPAHAATPKPQITDPAGDANGFNDQGLGAPIPSQSTAPADDAGADIISVTFVSTFTTKKVNRKLVKTPTGFTVTLALAAAPTPETFYRIVATVPGCSSLFHRVRHRCCQGWHRNAVPRRPARQQHDLHDRAGGG